MNEHAALDEYVVEIDEGATIARESFLNEDAALGFAEEIWLMGKKVTVFKNGDIYCEYEV